VSVRFPTVGHRVGRSGALRRRVCALRPSCGGMASQDVPTEPDHPDHPLRFKTALYALTKPWFTRTWVIQVSLARRANYMSNSNVFTQCELDTILEGTQCGENPIGSRNCWQILLRRGDI